MRFSVIPGIGYENIKTNDIAGYFIGDAYNLHKTTFKNHILLANKLLFYLLSGLFYNHINPVYCYAATGSRIICQY